MPERDVSLNLTIGVEVSVSHIQGGVVDQSSEVDKRRVRRTIKLSATTTGQPRDPESYSIERHNQT